MRIEAPAGSSCCHTQYFWSGTAAWLLKLSRSDSFLPMSRFRPARVYRLPSVDGKHPACLQASWSRHAHNCCQASRPGLKPLDCADARPENYCAFPHNWSGMYAYDNSDDRISKSSRHLLCGWFRERRVGLALPPTSAQPRELALHPPTASRTPPSVQMSRKRPVKQESPVWSRLGLGGAPKGRPRPAVSLG